MKRYVVAIDLGGTNIKIAVIKDEGVILKKLTLATKLYKTKNALIEGLARTSIILINELGFQKKDIW